MLEVKNLSVAVDGHELLHNLSFNIKKGETVYLLGPNGAGKTTAIRALIMNVAGAYCG